MAIKKLPAKLILGKPLAEAMLLDLAKKIKLLPRQPGLATILIGDDPASRLYVNQKKKFCQAIGIEFHEYLSHDGFYPNISQKELLEMIDWLNKDQTVDAIIIQLPLPKKFNQDLAIKKLDPAKDADGFHPQNRRKFLTDKNYPVPPLIQAIKIALTSTGENLKNKQAVIVANSSIFSQSLDLALQQLGIKTTTTVPSAKNLTALTTQADILISVLGKKYFIKPKMIKPGAIVIDAGTTLVGEKKYYGDVDPKVATVASYLTPVPGGIGPLTVAALLKNVYQLTKNSKQ